MTFLNVFVIILIVFLSLFWNKFSFINICEIDKCPYCFGKNVCNDFYDGKLTLKQDSIVNIFNNYFSVKNVYYGSYNNVDIVVKKLAHNFEFVKFDELICKNLNLSRNCDLNKLNDSQNYLFKITKDLTKIKHNEISNFKICTKAAVQEFLNLLLKKTSDQDIFKYIWTSLQLNVEPLLLQLLKSEEQWPVPKYLGACGRAIIENDCGISINNFQYSNWTIRANLAFQLLLAAKVFTERHPTLRFYLTDISPDNIAVSKDLKVTFVDLENMIITKKDSGSFIHYSSDFVDEEFSFSESEICETSLSDHNYFAVCKLLLSKKSPWPMMEGGLLHSSPDYIFKSYPQLFKFIELCVNPTGRTNRFEAAEEIMLLLQQFV